MEFSIVRPRSGKPFAIVVGHEYGRVAARCNVMRSATGYYCANLQSRSPRDRKELYDYVAQTLGGELSPKSDLTSLKNKEDMAPKRSQDDIVTVEGLRLLVREAIAERYINEFLEELIDDDRTSFTFDEAETVAIKTRCNTAYVINKLKSLGVEYDGRPVPKRVRGFGSNSHDRWSGPGSSPTHGGAATDAISGFAGVPSDRKR